MKKILLISVLLYLVSSCSPQASITKVWFDKPLPGSQYFYGGIQSIELFLHATDPGGVSQVEIFANGVSFVVLQGTGNQLAQFSTPWQPNAPGKYTLQARAKGEAGTWSEFATTIVIITDQALRDAPTATLGTAREIVLSPTNTLTSNSIFTYTPTLTFTPTSTWTPTPTFTFIPTRYISPTNPLVPTRGFTSTYTPVPTREPLSTHTPTPRGPDPTATGHVQPSPTPTRGR